VTDRRAQYAAEPWALFEIDDQDPAPAYIQLERRVRVRAGEVLAEVVLDEPPGQVIAAITRTSLDRLGLEPGRKASAYITASEITLEP
jgi:molybdopterin-binding protein